MQENTIEYQTMLKPSHTWTTKALPKKIPIDCTDMERSFQLDSGMGAKIYIRIRNGVINKKCKIANGDGRRGGEYGVE